MPSSSGTLVSNHILPTLLIGIVLVCLVVQVVKRYLQTQSFVTNRRILVLFSGGFVGVRIDVVIMWYTRGYRT